MLDDPEFQFKINKTRILIVSSFRALMLACAMCFMVWTVYMTWVVAYCHGTGNCISQFGSDGDDPSQPPSARILPKDIPDGNPSGLVP